MITKTLQLGFIASVFASAAFAGPTFYKKVAITCTNPGSHQDVAKTPTLKNTSSADIASGKTIYWTATDGDKGQILGPLKKGASVQVLGQAGNGYQCSAFYLVPIIVKPFPIDADDADVNEIFESEE